MFPQDASSFANKNYTKLATIQVMLCKFVSKKNLEVGLSMLHGVNDPFVEEATFSKFRVYKAKITCYPSFYSKHSMPPWCMLIVFFPSSKVIPKDVANFWSALFEPP